MEKKRTKDFISSGVLAWGVLIGKFVFEEDGVEVYAITECLHIRGSDVYSFAQISVDDYEKLLPESKVKGIPNSSIPENKLQSYKRRFLCGESEDWKNEFSLEDVDMSFVRKTKNRSNQ